MAKLFLWIWCEIFDDMELVAVIGFQSNTRYAFATFGKHEDDFGVDNRARVGDYSLLISVTRCRNNK